MMSKNELEAKLRGIVQAAGDYACQRCLDDGFEEVFSPHPVWPRYIVCPDCKNAAGVREPPGLVERS
jgi:hypothetical protein